MSGSTHGPARSDSLRQDIPALLVGAAAVCAVVSIAAMEILMGAAVVALIVSCGADGACRGCGCRCRCFCCLTLVSLAMNGHIREGLPQVKKFYVYLMLFLVRQGVRERASSPLDRDRLGGSGGGFVGLGAESVLQQI